MTTDAVIDLIFCSQTEGISAAAARIHTRPEQTHIINAGVQTHTPFLASSGMWSLNLEGHFVKQIRRVGRLSKHTGRGFPCVFTSIYLLVDATRASRVRLFELFYKHRESKGRVSDPERL